MGSQEVSFREDSAANRRFLWDSRNVDEEEDENAIGSLQSASSENMLSVVNLGDENASKRCSIFPFCSRSTAIKTSLFVLNLAGIGTTTFFIIYESLGSRNVINLTVCALVNGITISNFFHLILGRKKRSRSNAMVSAWAYETILSVSQVFLNVVPENLKKLAALPFIWSLGVFEAKDVLTLISMKQTDLSLSPAAPNNLEELIPTLGFKTRNYSTAAKVWILSLVVTSVGLTIFNFICKDKLLTINDFGQIGIYQDLIAMFTGSVFGEILARAFDDYKERRERKYAKQLIPQHMPIILRCLRFAKNGFYLFAPLSIGALLGIPAPANGLLDYFTKFSVGTIFGAKILIDRREFENPRSPCHQLRPALNNIRMPVVCQKATAPVKKCTPSCISLNDRVQATCDKVKAVANKYFPSIAFFAALTAYMIWAAMTNDPTVGYVIGALLFSTFFFFALTDIIGLRDRSNTRNRVCNELNFRLFHANISLSIPFQYLTT